MVHQVEGGHAVANGAEETLAVRREEEVTLAVDGAAEVVELVVEPDCTRHHGPHTHATPSPRGTGACVDASRKKQVGLGTPPTSPCGLLYVFVCVLIFQTGRISRPVQCGQPRCGTSPSSSR